MSYKWIFKGTEINNQTHKVMYHGTELKNIYAPDGQIWGKDDTWWRLSDDGWLYIYCAGDMPAGTITEITYSGGYHPQPWYYDKQRIRRVTMADSVTSIQPYAFAWYQSLTNISIGNRVTRIGEAAFDSCGVDWDKGIDGGKFDIIIPDSVKTIGKNAFFNTQVRNLYIGSGLTSIPENAFATTSYADDMAGRYYHGFVYGTLISISGGNNVNTIGVNAFACFRGQNINFPMIRTIAQSAFEASPYLRIVSLGADLYYIGQQAFNYCDRITDVYFGGTEQRWQTGVRKGAYNTPLTNATIHYNSTGPTT